MTSNREAKSEFMKKKVAFAEIVTIFLKNLFLDVLVVMVLQDITVEKAVNKNRLIEYDML